MNVLQQLDIDGFAVVPNVLNKQEVEYAKNRFFEWYSQVGDDIPAHGIHKFYNVGHQEHAWYIKTRPAVIDIFRNIWGCNELVVSFDGCCYIPRNFKRKDKSWAHTDQAPNQIGKHCIQGFVSLTANKNTSFVVYTKSHLLHEPYFKERNESHSRKWNLIDQAYMERIKKTRQVVQTNPGDLVLWDSRTFHENQYGNVSEERLVQYVCYLPKNDVNNTESQSEKRRHYFYTKRTTSHWPYPISVNQLQPQVYGKTEKLIDYTKLVNSDLTNYTDEILNLI